MSAAGAQSPRWRPLTFSAESVRAILAGRKTMTRRIVNPNTLRVRLPREVRSDLPTFSASPALVARPGRHRAAIHERGAVSLEVGGEMLGVRPGEFHFCCPYAEGETHLANHGARKVWTIKPERSMLWVKETWAGGPLGGEYKADGHEYGVDGDGEVIKVPWRSPRFMRRESSRISLRATDVRVERLQDITDEDAAREGARRFDDIPKSSRYCTARWSMEESPRDTGHCLGTPVWAFANAWNRIHGGVNWNLDGGHEHSPWDDNPWVWVLSFEVESLRR